MMNSGFEVIHPSTDQLVVVAHPMYWLVVITTLLIAVGLFLGIYSLRKSSYSGIGLGVFLILLGVFLSSLALSRGTATFDKKAGTVTFDRSGLLFRSQHLSFPLSDVRNATVQPMGGGSYHFIVILGQGGVQELIGSTGATGQFKAAEAVNQFIGSR